MRTSMTSTRSKVKVTELPKLRKVHFSRSISSAISSNVNIWRNLNGHISVVRDTAVTWLSTQVVLHVLCMLTWPSPDPSSRSQSIWTYDNCPELHISRSISSAISARSSKLMVGGHCMGPGLQFVGARFLNFHLGKLSREFKLRPISIFDEIQMAIFRRYCITLQSRGWACR